MLLRISVLALSMLPAALSQGLAPDVKAKVDAKLAALKSWAGDPALVDAVRQYNTSPSPEAKSMTNEKWKGLTLLDPTVRGFGKNPAALRMKALRGLEVAEAFVSGSDGGKVAFLSKPTSWCHKGKPKHDLPMSGKTWIGAIELDESTGQQQVQVSLPVLDAGKPIGSLVVGLAIAKL